MSIEDTIGYQTDAEACAVCGKNMADGGGFARVNHGGHFLSLCCPGCLKSFQRDPVPYLSLLEKILRYRALRDLTRPGSQEA